MGGSATVTRRHYERVIWALHPESYPSPIFMLLSGGLMFGAIFMATDPVTSPTTPLGSVIFGLGIG